MSIADFIILREIIMKNIKHTLSIFISLIVSTISSYAIDLKDCDAYIIATADCPVQLLQESSNNVTLRLDNWTTNGVKKYIMRLFYKSSTPSRWENVSFKFKALESGYLGVTLSSREVRGKGKKLIPFSTYYDDIKINGKLFANGDFEKGFDGWWYNKRIEVTPKIVKTPSITGGGACIRVCREASVSQGIPIEAGKTYEISFRTRFAGIAMQGGDDIQKNISTAFNCDQSMSKALGHILPRLNLSKKGRLIYNVRFASNSNNGKIAYIPRNKIASKFSQSIEFDVSSDEASNRYLYVLHTAFDTFNSKDTAIGRVVFTLDNGSVLKKDVHIGRDIWWVNGKDKLLMNGKPVPANGGRLYFSRFELPTSGVVKKIGFVGFYKSPWAIYAATFSDTNEYPFKIVTPSEEKWTKADIPESFDIEKGSAMDLSNMVFTPIPAGATGRAIVSDRGTLTFEKTPEIDARFKSYSLWSSLLLANLPVTEKYEKISKYAARLRTQGYNLVRIKIDYLKSYNLKDKKDEYYDSVDFLFSELKKNGVYYQIIFGTYDDGRQGYKFGDHNDIKMLAILGEEDALRRWKESTVEMLEHINPYTGLAWKDDPAMLMVEYYNELTNSMGRVNGLSPNVRKMAGDMFIEYLKGKYKTVQELNDSWNKMGFAKNKYDFKDFKDVVKPIIHTRNLDWLEFGWYRITKFGEFAEKVVADAGYKGLIGECNTGSSFAGKYYTNRFTDVLILNSYYSHPSGFSGRDVTCNLKSALPNFWINNVASRRLNNRPSSITEYNYCFWNPYRYEACVLISPYCALQNFSVMTIHQDVISMSGTIKTPRIGAFTVGTSPIMRASELMMSCFFMRGDVKASGHRVDMSVSDDFLKTSQAQHAQNIEQTKISLLSGYASKFKDMNFRKELCKVKTKPADIEISPMGSSEIRQEEWFQEVVNDGKSASFNLSKFVEKMREKKVLSPTNKTNIENGIFHSDTEQILLDSKNNVMSVSTEYSQGVAMETSGKIDLGNLKVLSTSVPATIGVVTVDGKRISESSRLVFVYATREKNIDMQTSFDDSYCVTLGNGPVVILNGKVEAELKLDSSKKYSVYPLSLTGVRREKLGMPIENGVMKISIDNSKLKNGSTSMFEIVAD